jgi:hypothetical protein
VGDTERAHLLRVARTRALARLRAEQNDRYQELMDEEVARLGGAPRVRTQDYQPRGAWHNEGNQG